nr:ribonuclease H-like domain-containing protein [Tanacetum cinerariifolium]
MTRRVLLRCDSTGDLYPVTAQSPIPQVFLVSQHTWHQCLGYPGNDVLRRLVSNNFISCNKEKPLALCRACQLGKHARLPFPHVFAKLESMTKSERFLLITRNNIIRNNATQHVTSWMSKTLVSRMLIDKKDMRNWRWSRVRVKIPRAVTSKKHDTS